jgi:hypothetical protein
MVEKSFVVLPLVWTFAPNDLPRPLQNLTVKLSIGGLTRGYNFLWTNPWMSKKTINMDLTLLRTWRAFFGQRWIWWLPLRQLLLSFRVITMHPCFVTGYGIGNGVGFVSGLFEFPADRNAMGLLIVAQQSWHKFLRNASHIQIVRQMRWTVSYDSPTISQTSWIVRLRSARIVLRTFALFSGAVHVDGRPERPSSSTDFSPCFKRF